MSGFYASILYLEIHSLHVTVGGWGFYIHSEA